MLQINIISLLRGRLAQPVRRSSQSEGGLARATR